MCVFSLALKLDSELALRMSFGSELAISVHVFGTERRGASVEDCRDRVVTWRCRSSSMYGEKEVDRALCVMTAIFVFCTGCAVGQAASEETLI